MSSPIRGRCLCGAVLGDPLDREPSGHVSFEERVTWFPFHDELPRYVGKSGDLAG